MAGSYSHIVTESGNLRSNEHVADMLENGGDVFEAVEEMYGMIWWLAYKLDGPVDPESLDYESRLIKYADVKLAIEAAQENYTEGLRIAKEVNKT